MSLVCHIILTATRRFDMRKPGFRLPRGSVLVVIVVLFVVLVLLSSSYVQVEYGTVGLVTRFGAVTGRIMRPGLNWKIPLFESVVPYRTQEVVYQTAEQ
jgi:regulator of protease activity HflC (stomatin/prohibitin superfamily)